MSLVRFYHGWIKEQFLEIAFHFKYFGFHWVSVAEPNVLRAFFSSYDKCPLRGVRPLYVLHRAILCTLYYFELLDATYYLNHYFISCCAFLMIFLPAHHAFSLDQKLLDGGPRKSPHGRFTLGTVYPLVFFAGIAIQPDWLWKPCL